MDENNRQQLLKQLHDLKNNQDNQPTCLNLLTINNMIDALEKNDTVIDCNRLEALQKGTSKYQFTSSRDINSVMEEL